MSFSPRNRSKTKNWRMLIALRNFWKLECQSRPKKSSNLLVKQPKLAVLKCLSHRNASRTRSNIPRVSTQKTQAHPQIQKDGYPNGRGPDSRS